MYMTRDPNDKIQPIIVNEYPDLKPITLMGGPSLSKLASNYGATILDNPAQEVRDFKTEALRQTGQYATQYIESSPVFDSMTEIRVDPIEQHRAALLLFVETLTKRGFAANVALSCAMALIKE